MRKRISDVTIGVIYSILAIGVGIAVLWASHLEVENASENSTIVASSVVQSEKEEFPNELIRGKERTTYDKAGFGDSYRIYSFKNYEQVLYEINCNNWFLLGDKSEGNKGTAYFDICLYSETWRDPQLVAITPNYLIFSVKAYGNKDESREKIAVEIAETMGNFDDRIFHKSIPFELLPLNELLHLDEVVSIETVVNTNYSDVSLPIIY